MTDMASAVFNYLQDRKIENPFVLGHSMGGYVGLELLRQMPVELTLIHSNFWEDPESKKLDRNRVIEIVKTNKSLFLNESIPHLFAPENRITNQTEIQKLIQQATKIPVNEICAATAGLRDRKSSYDLMEAANISLIHGNQDPVIPNGILNAALQKLTKKPKVFEIENCGHMAFIEQPQHLINHLTSILFQ
jgi:pimeloyl-ACP methyl ester carboxylesterase